MEKEKAEPVMMLLQRDEAEAFGRILALRKSIGEHFKQSVSLEKAIAMYSLGHVFGSDEFLDWTKSV